MVIGIHGSIKGSQILKTSSLIGYYYAKGDHVAVDGLASVEEVQNSIAEVLEG